jgi:hypothetical protein
MFWWLFWNKRKLKSIMNVKFTPIDGWLGGLSWKVTFKIIPRDMTDEEIKLIDEFTDRLVREVFRK